MRVHLQGCEYRVTATAIEVSIFVEQWPGSGMPDEPFWAIFNRKNDDVVEYKQTHGFESADPAAIAALCNDMKIYATTRFAFK